MKQILILIITLISISAFGQSVVSTEINYISEDDVITYKEIVKTFDDGVILTRLIPVTELSAKELQRKDIEKLRAEIDDAKRQKNQLLEAIDKLNKIIQDNAAEIKEIRQKWVGELNDE